MRYFNYEFFSGRKDQNHWIAEVMRVQISNSWNEHKYNIAFVFFKNSLDTYIVFDQHSLSFTEVYIKQRQWHNAHQVYF